MKTSLKEQKKEQNKTKQNKTKEKLIQQVEADRTKLNESVTGGKREKSNLSLLK